MLNRFRNQRTTHRNPLLILAVLGLLAIVTASNVIADDEIGLNVPPGFKVQKFADDGLAHDIFSMTIDTAGRVVVSGPGYIRILADVDGDGVADKARKFADGPASGAQGMCFIGRDLLAVGDGGLLLYRDSNADDRADGKPELFLKVKTGSEHNAHAIRRGPDGYWYFLIGNTAEITSGYATIAKSHVTQPHGGVMLRLKPDLSGGEILADGFRNAYDFDFNNQGDLFVYDSDGERDISLPWYQPTRVFHMLPGMEHGWITESWKRPNYGFDSAPVLTSTGRGSPSGVACYRHTQFPAEYQGGLFLLDWTFGRVWFTPVQKNSATWAGEAREFITTRGQFGFAPTDIEVGVDGSLYVCVGGRGTHGTIYKVSYDATTLAANDAVPVPPQLPQVGSVLPVPTSPASTAVGQATATSSQEPLSLPKNPEPQLLDQPSNEKSAGNKTDSPGKIPERLPASPFARNRVLQTSGEEVPTGGPVVTAVANSSEAVEPISLDAEELSIPKPTARPTVATPAAMPTELPAEPATGSPTNTSSGTGSPTNTGSKDGTATSPTSTASGKAARGIAPDSQWPAQFSVSIDSPPATRLTACLTAPQPLSAWSRARWVPLARSLGAAPLLAAALNDTLPQAQRVRAIEILTELFDGVPGTAAELLSSTSSADVRARAIWSLGIHTSTRTDPAIISKYLSDSDAAVRRAALESLWWYGGSLEPLAGRIAVCLNDPDRVVRVAAARLIPDMPGATFKLVSQEVRKLGWRAAVANTFGYVWRTQQQKQPYNAYAVDVGRRVIDSRQDAASKLEATRLVQLALGDLATASAAAPVFEGYTTGVDLKPYNKDIELLQASILRTFPTKDRVLDLELARTLAMTAPAQPAALDAVLAQITSDSSPVNDIHYLAVAARCTAKRTESQRSRIAAALVNIEHKVIAMKLPQDNNWVDRVGEVYSSLADTDLPLAEAVLKQPGFGRPSHVIYLSKLPEDASAEAAEAMYKAVTSDPAYPWNNDVVFVFGMVGSESHLNLVRSLRDRFDVRTAVLMVLSDHAQEQDRELFAQGLDFGSAEAVQGCVNALEKLPVSKNPVEIVSLVKLLRRLGTEKSDYALREQVVAILKKNVGEDFGFKAGVVGFTPQADVVQRWTDYVYKEFPAQSADLLGGAEQDLAELQTLLAKVDWNAGDAERGRRLYATRGCAQCHSSGSGLGPDLAGSTGRFSRDDLFIAIAMPNRDVSPRYQTTLVETKAGKTYTGMIVYESVDGVLLRNGTNQTFRIEARDIESQRALPNSLMPVGLLKDLSSSDLADLYTFMRTLGVQTTAASPAGTRKE